MKKTEGGETTVFVNGYYQKNVTTGTVTKYYYLGGRMVAVKEGATLRYVHQDHLGSSSVATGSAGSTVGTQKYKPFGETRSSSGSFGTDKKFTGQRLDGTGLYFYNARYYDVALGRFVSADTIVPSMVNPQALNRYAYVLNNPLRFTDPTGHSISIFGKVCQAAKDLVKKADDIPDKLDDLKNLTVDRVPGAISTGWHESQDAVTNAWQTVSVPVVDAISSVPTVTSVVADKSNAALLSAWQATGVPVVEALEETFVDNCWDCFGQAATGGVVVILGVGLVYSGVHLVGLGSAMTAGSPATGPATPLAVTAGMVVIGLGLGHISWGAVAISVGEKVIEDAYWPPTDQVPASESRILDSQANFELPYWMGI